MNFGEYFRNLRKQKKYTQEAVAEKIGKSKMLVSGIENGRNGAFLDGDLEIISSLFELNSEEKRKLFLEASKTRERIPIHILNYMNEHDDLYYILDIVSKSNFGDRKLKLLKKYVEEINDAKNN